MIMRIYRDCYELMSEIAREVIEMGVRVHPKSMQNKIVDGNPNFETLEILNYSYCLKSRDRVEALFISDPRSKNWVIGEFNERINSHSGNPGEAWRIRPELWGPLQNANGEFDYTYSERLNFNHNLSRIIAEILVNPESRQLLLPIFRPTDVEYMGGKARIPCSVYYQFFVRDGRVDIVYSQRSADVYTHFGNDVWLAWELMSYVARSTGENPGYLYHNIGSLHVYNKDIEKLKECIAEKL